MSQRPHPADAPIPFAADYADALLVLRRSKSAIELLLLLMLLLLIGLFATVRYADVLPVANSENGIATSPLSDGLLYATAIVQSLGLILGILLPVVLILMHHVMLVGRLLGLARVTAGLVWSIFLLLMLIPWQTMLAVEGLGRPDVVIPGVMFGWRELLAGARFDEAGLQGALRWFRFVGAPVLAIVVLLIVRINSGRGVRLALGEDRLPDELMNP